MTDQKREREHDLQDTTDLKKTCTQPSRDNGPAIIYANAVQIGTHEWWPRQEVRIGRVIRPGEQYRIVRFDDLYGPAKEP